MLFKVSGISGKAEIEEEEVVVEVTETSRRALVDLLGVERRNRILSALYLVRQDGVNVVRQSSVHIWKALVQKYVIFFIYFTRGISNDTSVFL